MAAVYLLLFHKRKREGEQMKKIIAVLLMMAVLVCGCGRSGISQEEYDKVVAERDELQKDNENLKKLRI